MRDGGGQLAGWRLPVEASRPSRLTLTLIGVVPLAWVIQRTVGEARGPGPADEGSPAKHLLLLSLSMASVILSLLLGPR